MNLVLDKHIQFLLRTIVVLPFAAKLNTFLHCRVRGLISELGQRFLEGSIVHGVVKPHAPFGFFVDLGIPEAEGLVRIIGVKGEPPVAPLPTTRPSDQRLRHTFGACQLPVVCKSS